MTSSQATAHQTFSPEEHEGAALFLELARVAADLAEREHLRTFTLPYPPAAQLALDHTVSYCLARGHTPPKSVPQLMAWCREHTAGGALFQVPPTLVTSGALLIAPVALLPTRSCWELASVGPSGRVEQEAVRLLADLAARCETPAAYERCRRYLMEHPVIVQQDRMPALPRSRWNRELWSRVKSLYTRIPEHLLSDRALVLCDTCGLPARVKYEAGSGLPARWCERERCPADTPTRRISNPGRALILRCSLRTFLVLPGRTERAALNEFVRAEITHEFVPAGLGAYRVEDAACRSWLMRVDDRRQPAALAARTAETDPDLPDQVLVVAPGELAADPGYRAAFETALGAGRRRRTVLTAPENLVSHLRAGSTPREEERDDA
ncbi:hypothetical protein ACIBK8_30465 [Streptomyces sp. NPDC050161]|uniref:pPIWI_RE_Y domain-containing protein n=1 Tax=Streptomyces sp. NPDC050161 TaxID=3365604 RepID=UPI0037AB8B4F